MSRSSLIHRLLVLVAVLGLGIPAQDAAAQTGGTPTFEAAPCDLPGLAPPLLPRLQCGTVAVPRGRGSQQGGSFRLAVVIIKAEASRKEADPVVYIAGGPGSPLTVRAALIAQHEAAVLAPNRDLILVDQRGAGRSEPLLCPDLSRQQMAIFARGLDPQALVRDWRASYGLCRLTMADDGVKPDWFGTRTTAEDFEAVRQALGIERWNVYALSYGTAVALTMMALHPASLRAVVLDSVFPPDPVPLTLPQTFGHARDLLFAACRDDARCAAAHPDLPAAFEDALRELDTAPLTIAMKPGLGLGTFTLRATVFRLIVDRLLYSRQGVAVLPAFIEAAHHRDPTAMQDLVGRIAQGYLAMAVGDMAAVECRDRVSWQEPASATGPDEQPVSAFVPGMCENWSPPGPPPLIARTDVPSLLLAGAIDPITPPAFARRAAAALGPKATVVEFAHVGHGAQQSSPCGEALVTAFMRDPASPVEATCAARIAPITFR